MSFLSRSAYSTPPGNLCELLLRDVTSLVVTSRLISRHLLAFRPQCEFSGELTAILDSIVALSRDGESRLQPALEEAGAVLPESTDTLTGALLADFFTRIPASATPGTLAAEVASNLRLLAQHLGLKALLAAEEAVLVGQNRLSGVLLDWSAEWRACGHTLRAATVRARAQAYVADLPASASAQSG